MIEISKTKVYGFEGAIRGMRNAMNSWNKSDSWQSDFTDDGKGGFVLGSNDRALAKTLVKAGSDHRKFLRQIFVSVDIMAPLYYFKEYDTYKVGTVANSTSTMHKIHAKEFTLNDFSCERLHNRALKCLENTIKELNFWRDIYNNGGMVDNADTTVTVYEPKDPEAWHNMIQLLPSSYNQLRTCTLNYENLLNIYYARRNHKLPEWHTFCEWIETLPYFKEMCLEDKAG